MTDDTPETTEVRELAARARDRLATHAADAAGARASACALIERVLAARSVDPADPYCGHFYWDENERFVHDLNASAFVLLSLLPIVAEHAAGLPAELYDRLRSAGGEALDAMRRVGVSADYTNAAAMHVFAHLVGGQLLGRDEHVQEGRHKLGALARRAALDGGAHEYNSPTYTPLAILALQATARYAATPGDRALAQWLAARWALSMAVHLDPAGRWWSGPFGRAYTPDFIEGEPLRLQRELFIARHEALPAWIDAVSRAAPAGVFAVNETASRKRGNHLSTHSTAMASLGVASRQGIGEQGVSLLARVATPRGSGVMLSRLMADDMFRVQAWADEAAGAAPRPYLLAEQGRLFSACDGPRALLVYSPDPLVEVSDLSNIRAGLRWWLPGGPDEVLVDGLPVTVWPMTVQPGQTVAVCAGETAFVVVPMAHARLGARSRIELQRRGDDLLLQTVLYEGPRKGFWDLLSPHDAGRYLDWAPMYRGAPHAPFFVEMATLDVADLASVAARVAAGRLEAWLGDSIGEDDDAQRLWRASYQREGVALALAVDLMQWRLIERSPPVLALPLLLDAAQAKASIEGELRVGDVTLHAPGAAVWLAVAGELTIAGVWRDGAAGPVLVRRDDGRTLRLPAATTVLIEWQGRSVSVQATDGPLQPVCEGFQPA